AEVTMSLMAGARLKNPALGYAPDFVEVLAPLLKEIAAKGTRIVANAGGVNPLACRDALVKACAAAGVDIPIAVVLGDDLTPQVEALRAGGVTELGSGAPMPKRFLSMNAYLGGRPIAVALEAGAQIVVTGRVSDSALALGPLMWAFGWTETQYDLLAAGTLCGHVLECGAQATGGNFTDWRDVPDYDDMGFPIAEVSADGSFVLTKPKGTGGLVSPATVGEQMLYEIGDPRAYMLADVAADFSRVRMAQIGKDRVKVEGAKGRAPTASYKVSATYMDGFRAVAGFMIGGREAAEKGRRVADAILAKTRRRFREANLGDYRAVDVALAGAESIYGANARPDSREVVVRIATLHDDKRALEIFGREIAPAATGMAPGMTGFMRGRPKAEPVIRLFSCLVPKERVKVEVHIGDKVIPVAIPTAGGYQPPPPDTVPATPVPAGERIEVPLWRLAWGRSGDKGDLSNIGLISRRPEYAAIIREQVTPEAVGAYFAHYCNGKVTRYELPGMDAFNFVLEGALGGGGMASLRVDPLGKTHAQVLLDMTVTVPRALLG
ncbi:MAG: DUF1446 domain-containing protein, partial [Alphaproteobacteria bacterium]|nr:DUF1446 domain-containing protein [Alphaproteobacteria bacterium]